MCSLRRRWKSAAALNPRGGAGGDGGPTVEAVVELHWGQGAMAPWPMKISSA